MTMQKKSFIWELIKFTITINNADFLRDMFNKLYTHYLHAYSHHIKSELIYTYYTDCILETRMNK